MGVFDASLPYIVNKVRCWVSKENHFSDISEDFWMPEKGCWVCYKCDLHFTALRRRHQCQCCGHVFCSTCIQDMTSTVTDVSKTTVEKRESIESCEFCFQGIGQENVDFENMSPHSPSNFHSTNNGQYTNQPFGDYDLAHLFEVHQESSLWTAEGSSVASSTDQSPLSIQTLDRRSYEDDCADIEKSLFNASSEYCQNASRDISYRNSFVSIVCTNSESSWSPSLMARSLKTAVCSLHSDLDGNNHMSAANSNDIESNCEFSHQMHTFQSQCQPPPLRFEDNGLVWYPPPPENERYDLEGNFIECDDDEDIGSCGFLLSPSFFDIENKQNHGNKESLQAAVHGHFKALVSHLLKVEAICTGCENDTEVWLDIVSSLAWDAANFVKTDSSSGGSMDPGDYVKIKCIASGCPNDSILIKGVVCTKNIKHKRMASKYHNPRLLLLGGALEYQRLPNQLSSIGTLLQQEMDHIRMTIANIETYRPNVLLVEKSVSSYAQEYLLAKDISLVLNVKMPLLERIARCTGASIAPSIDNLSSARLGQCEMFRLERFSEECSTIDSSNKKSNKTLMYFEGCPRRLGCTVLLRGRSGKELKKVKHVVQYAVFAAYHLSLQTSFLADEGAIVPKTPVSPSVAAFQNIRSGDSMVIEASKTNALSNIAKQSSFHSVDTKYGLSQHISFPIYEMGNLSLNPPEVSDLVEYDELQEPAYSDGRSCSEQEMFETSFEEDDGITQNCWQNVTANRKHISAECLGPSDNHQSILVSLSIRCILKGTVCERSQLFRIKFYGSFDKPIGRFLRDDLFDKTNCCQSCNGSAEAHVRTYTHQQGSLIISVRCIPSLKLPGEQDGKIWMWHRCLSCVQEDGIPPASRRVVMSDAAWGLSFGKYLELSFSNHAAANRVASCGHSLQRDCLHFFGFGNMVAFFRYSPVDVLSVHLPSSILEFNAHFQEDWVKNEAMEIGDNMKSLHEEIFDIIIGFEKKILSLGEELSKASAFCKHIAELKDLLEEEKTEYSRKLQQFIIKNSHSGQATADILDLNSLRRCILIDSYLWDRRICMFSSCLKANSFTCKVHPYLHENISSQMKEYCNNSPHHPESSIGPKDTHLYGREFQIEGSDLNLILKDFSSIMPNLSDEIDLAWSGTGKMDEHFSLSSTSVKLIENASDKKFVFPVRVSSFDSSLVALNKTHIGLTPASTHLSSVKSFHAREDLTVESRDPIPQMIKDYFHTSEKGNQKLNFIFGYAPLFLSSTSNLVNGGIRLLLPQAGRNNVVIAVDENDPASIISYALNSKQYGECVEGELYDFKGGNHSENVPTGLPSCQSFNSLESNDVQSRSYFSYDTSSEGSVISNSKNSHARISFTDESSFHVGKAKFVVTCYFAKQFDSLRKRCCQNELDFIRSLSRSKRWKAQGGKSNAYFARTLDGRFVIKGVTKTELDSFDEFAPEYFKYMSESLSSGSPTCLAKVLGIYQVMTKNFKGGKEVKMDLMVTENLFFGRNISSVYDLKGCVRSRYNSDTMGRDKVLLDMNLLEILHTKPIFLRRKAKRNLERAVWNDTSFLASVHVMDYSLLVGVDEEKGELVLGIIDFLRQYTWDKHLETWVKASGILGGPKNASPTVVSPEQYKKRFRKAMSTYFLTIPDQWSS